MSTDLKYKIQLDLDPRLIDEGRAKIEALEKQLEPFRNKATFDRLTRELKQFQAEAKSPEWVNNLKHGLRDLTADIPVVGKLFGGMLNGLTGPLLAITTGFEVARRGLRAFAEEELATRGMDKALANRGKLTADLRNQYLELASAIQAATGIDKGAVLGSVSQLLKFGAPIAEVANYTDTIVNLAGKLNVDLPEATNLTVRAMNGFTRGLQMHGIVLDKNLSQTERMVQLQKLVAGNAPQINTNTLTGTMKVIGVQEKTFWENIGGLLGAVILPELRSIASWITLANGGFEKMVGWAGQLKNRLIDMIPGGKQSGPDIDLSGLKNKIGDAVLTAADLGDEFAGLDQAADKAAATGLKAVEERLKSITDRLQKLREANLDKTLANIDQQVATGKISPAQGAAQKSAAHAKAGVEKEQDEADAARQLAAAAQAELARLATERDAILQARSKPMPALLKAQEQLRNQGDVVLQAGGYHEPAPALQSTASLAAWDKKILAEIDRVKGLALGAVDPAKLAGAKSPEDIKQAKDDAAGTAAVAGLSGASPEAMEQFRVNRLRDETKAYLKKLLDYHNALTKAQDAFTDVDKAKSTAQPLLDKNSAAQESARTVLDNATTAQTAAQIKGEAGTTKSSAEQLEAAKKALREEAKDKAELALLNAKTQLLNARTPEEHRAALVSERNAEIAPLQREINETKGAAVSVEAVTDKDAKAKLAALQAQIDHVKGKAVSVEAVTDPAAQAKLAALQAQINQVKGAAVSIEAVTDPVEKAKVLKLEAQKNHVEAQFNSRLQESDQGRTRFEAPKMDVDQFAKVGMFIGGEAPADSDAKSTARATAMLAAWAKAGAPVTPKNTGHGKGATYVG